VEILARALEILGFLAFGVFLYFFTVTRLAIAIKSFFRKPGTARAGLYWLYTNPFLIWLTDNQLVVSAVLLFQYRRLAATVIKHIGPLPKQGRVLQVSCAYGNFSEKLAKTCRRLKASELVVCDLVGNQLKNVEKKLAPYPGKVTLVRQDAAQLAFADQSFDSVVVFFLFHELIYEDKVKALSEAMRVVRPGGKVVLAEFHRPRARIMRFFGRAYFWLFEPFALDMWGRFRPEALIRGDTERGWTIERESFLFDNFQTIAATRTLV
jgi:ubiquinone/menaquinone biosynthesis C-methylase UbiE